MRSQTLHCAPFEVLQPNGEAEVLKKRTGEKQQQNQQIKVEKERENGFVFVDQGIVGLRRFEHKFVDLVIKA